MWLRPGDDTRDIRVLTIRHGTPVGALILGILPAGGFLLPFFL
jgi:hypothetical protein